MKNIDVIIEKYDALRKQHNEKIEQGIRPSMQEIQNLLTLARMYARAITEMHNRLWTEYRRMNHQNEKMKRAGMTFLPAVKRLEELKEQSQEARMGMAELGENLMMLLDKWQALGASYDDLLTLCNANYPGMRKRLKRFYEDGKEHDNSFSALVLVHNLDYKNPHDSGCLEDDIDAPMTHCVKECLLDKMINDPVGKAAAHEAMMQVFPDIMEHAMIMRTDEDGIRRLYDKDGECVGEVPTNG